MPLQGSGSISISEIVAEFGGTAPHSLSEYYKDGDNVPSTKAISASATKSTDGDTDDFGGVTGLTVTRATDSVTAPSGSGTGSGSAGGITVTVSSSGTFVKDLGSQTVQDEFQSSLSVTAGNRVRATWSYIGGGFAAITFQDNGSPPSNVGSASITSSGGTATVPSGAVKATFSVGGGGGANGGAYTLTHQNPSATAYQIQFNNTNAYAVSLTSSSTGGARTLSASSGNVTVQAGSTTDNQDWTIASTAPTVYDFSVTNGTGVDGTANSTSVANGATVTISDNQGSSSLAVSWSATETINADVPTSGAISMTDFYNAEDE